MECLAVDALQELAGLVFTLEACVEVGTYLCGLGGAVVHNECSIDLVVRFCFEVLYLAFAFHDESHAYRLHTSGRECGFQFFPKHWREFESHDAVQHASCLLCVHQVDVYGAWMIYGFEYGVFGNFVKYDSFCAFQVEVKHLGQMPRYGFSFAVFIGSKPHGFGFACVFLQLAHQGFLLFWYFIFGVEVAQIYSEVFLPQVAYVAVARHHFIVFTQELLYRLRLGWRLDYHQILLHLTIFC